MHPAVLRHPAKDLANGPLENPGSPSGVHTALLVPILQFLQYFWPEVIEASQHEIGAGECIRRRRIARVRHRHNKQARGGGGPKPIA
jgi:hypothetical protein